MKNKTTAKPTTQPRKPPERWPRFFRNMLEQLDVAGDDPVFLAKADITPETQSHVANLMAQGLLSEEPTNSIACISCDATATIRRKGAKGETASALCPCCGTLFQTNGKELRQWRADWNSLGLWLKGMAGTDGEMEAISPQVLFLGNISRGQERFEIYLARLLTDQTSAQQAYTSISQSMNGSGIVLSLAGNSKPTNPKIAVVRLSDCLVISGGKFELAWPEHAFSGKDPAKQRAAFIGVQNDPRQKQKACLKAWIKKKLPYLFKDKPHHQIAAEIITNHAENAAYQDRNGKTQHLSKYMVLDAVKEVLCENGLEDWISGTKFKP